MVFGGRGQEIIDFRWTSEIVVRRVCCESLDMVRER